MRTFLIALALVVPLTSQASPNAAVGAGSSDFATLTATQTTFTAASALTKPDDAAASFLHMAVGGGHPTGGMRGAFSGVLSAEISTDLLDVFLDETMELAVANIPLPFKTMNLPPLAGVWLGGLSRPPVLLPEPFSYSILSVGLLGFIISRFRRAPT